MILGLLTRTDAVDTELVSSKVNLMERYSKRPANLSTDQSENLGIHQLGKRITTQFRDHITIKHRALQDQNN